MEKDHKLRILFFIGSLRSGGKERRMIELLTYLNGKGRYELLVALTQNEIHYPDFFKLNIPHVVLKRRWKRSDPTLPLQFYRICNQFQPHIIHAWGRMQSFYTLPAVIAQGVPLVNSQITAAPPKLKRWSLPNLIDRLNFRFSKIILSNSKAGIDTYKPPAAKSRVVYNGINMNRFAELPSIDDIKRKYGIATPYTVIMSASFTPHKDYNTFYRIAEQITNARDDVSFIGVGGVDKDDSEFRRLQSISSGNLRILFPGRINDVEALVNACSIGVLFSNKQVHGEGISNSIMEYMSLAKPVVANDAGGTREIVHHNQNGYLILNQSEEEIIALINDLINDQEKRASFGRASKKIIEETFSLESMGKAFEQVYQEAIT
ncbi:glycosyltransferase family 4 protein [Pontibacter akesuensis]|uniref:Glycosyltransferase involved in cell wall bisynthesis n=1 Tax=Pontibacter akesuensis TaxID=388950 RepID=A0A1I7J267_9BACT|nr:glycosyltransferase family 4 protein [Pontibacter akesuensis]GHA72841.1 hypothetical protein GCM10007389_28350 [Pontibacter akesuensis]SFU79288.1 Glycosyltransferase involved in cell wall bisynthesis [Pontibacter akesuensis]